jgi:CheY-like chemotaxis protein
MGVNMTKILLVEDDKSLREIYGVRLLAEGYQITSAGDGEEALAMAVKERPDLIISDVMMPKISGFDMLDILRSTPETKDIKVIMMTALSSEDQRARGESLGANRYLVKSQVGIEDVVRTVHDVLADAPILTTPTPAQAFGAPAASAVVTTSQPAPTPTLFQTITPATPPQTVTTPQPTPITSTAPAMPQTIEQTIPTNQQVPVQPTPVMAQQPQFPQPAPTMPPVSTTPAMTSSQPVSSETPVIPSQLPQPTAPFSTPPPALLGDRVVNPIQPSVPDIATLIDQELKNGVPPTPPPIAPQA